MDENFVLKFKQELSPYNLGEVIGLIPPRLYTKTESIPRKYFASPL